jgi:hypothetical protein
LGEAGEEGSEEAAGEAPFLDVIRVGGEVFEFEVEV